MGNLGELRDFGICIPGVFPAQEPVELTALDWALYLRLWGQEWG